jgi:hypothetical protein
MKTGHLRSAPQRPLRALSHRDPGESAAWGVLALAVASATTARPLPARK